MNSSPLNQQVEAIEPGARPAPARKRWLPLRPTQLALVGCTVVVLLWLLGPALLWAYDVERAGRLIDRGMSWPTPRLAGSQPRALDERALDQALQHLAAAIRHRPSHPHAYRLAGQIYAARGSWEQAGAALERASALAPQNPLLRGEADRAYAQAWQIVERAPRQSMMDSLAAGQLTAPGLIVRSLYCNDTGAASCYFGRGAYSLPYAAAPDTPPREFPVLALHPPASLRRAIRIPPEQPALSFVVGLDPVARLWATDGATFRVWVTPSARARQLVAEVALDRAAALSGWTPGWADLSAWAGQTVTLEIESGAGLADDTTDDWYGWGDLALTTVDAARYAATIPWPRVRQR